MHKADWIWRRRTDAPPVQVTQAHIDAIRTLRVTWDSVEAGAAALATPDSSESLPPEFDRAVDVFLRFGSVESFSGTLEISPAGDEEDEIGDIPDPGVRRLFMDGGRVSFEASAEELLLWAEANTGADGIDPKRPFGTEDVERDIRFVIDPDGELDAQTFSARRAELESRLALVLQFFVQHAELPLGEYWQGPGGDWMEVDEAPQPREYDADDWFSLLTAQFTPQNRAYTDTVMHLQHLVWDGRVPGVYSDWVERFRLQDLYEEYQPPVYTGSTLEISMAAHSAFDLPIFGLIAARVHNARGEFRRALGWLEKIDRLDIPAEKADLKSLSYPNVCLLEGIIARFGTGELTAEDYESALAGSHVLTRDRGPYPWVFDVLHEAAAPAGEAVLWHHCRAVCAQVHIMRGPNRKPSFASLTRPS